MISAKLCFLATACTVLAVVYGGSSYDTPVYPSYKHKDDYNKKDYDYGGGKKDNDYGYDKDDYGKKDDDDKKDDYKKDDYKKDNDYGKMKEYGNKKKDYGKKMDYGKKDDDKKDKSKKYVYVTEKKCSKYTYKCTVEPDFDPKVTVSGAPSQVTCTLPEGKNFGKDFIATNSPGAPANPGRKKRSTKTRPQTHNSLTQSRNVRGDGGDGLLELIQYLGAIFSASQDNLRWTMCGDCCKAWMISRGKDPEEVAPIVRKHGHSFFLSENDNEQKFKCMCCERKCKSDKDKSKKSKSKSKSKSKKSSSSSSEEDGY